MYVLHVCVCSCIGGGVPCTINQCSASFPTLSLSLSLSLSVFLCLGVPPRQSSSIPIAQSPNGQRMYVCMYITHSATPIITNGKKVMKCPYFKLTLGEKKECLSVSVNFRGVLRRGFHHSTDAVQSLVCRLRNVRRDSLYIPQWLYSHFGGNMA